MIIYKNKWALITGASTGLGKVYAEQLARKGANVILVARNQNALETIAAQLQTQYGVKTFVFAKDLAKLASSEELFNEIQAAEIHVDILINNAGFGVFGRLDETDLHRNQDLLMLNVIAVSSLTQLFLKPMLATKSGMIINIASTASFQPVPYMSNYGASKGFVRQFTEALWAEHQKDGVQFLAVCPGVTDTKFFDVLGTEPGATGKKDRPENVVEQTFKALEQNKIYFISGPLSNNVLSQLGRFFTHKFIARTAEKVMRPKSSLSADVNTPLEFADRNIFENAEKTSSIISF